MTWKKKKDPEISLPSCWTSKSLNVEKILAVKDTTLCTCGKKAWQKRKIQAYQDLKPDLCDTGDKDREKGQY